jgi:hypothetical protein
MRSARGRNESRELLKARKAVAATSQKAHVQSPKKNCQPN